MYSRLGSLRPHQLVDMHHRTLSDQKFLEFLHLSGIEG